MPTQGAVAEHLGLGKTTRVRELRDEGKIPDPSSATMDEIRWAYIAYLRAVASGRQKEQTPKSIDLNEARARLADEQRREKELKNAALVGELVDRESVLREWTARISVCKSRLRAIPKLAVTAGVPKKHARALLRLVDEALDELSGERNSEDDEAA